MARSKNPKPSRGSTRAESRIKTILFGAGLIGIVVVGAIVLALGRDASQAEVPAVQVVAGGIQGEAAALDLSAYAGDVVVVNFMASWCTSCWTEIPEFVSLYQERQVEGLVVIGISLQTPGAQTLEMIDQLGITYPVFQDEDASVALERFRLRSMPTTFVFDRQGREAHRFNGLVLGRTLREAVNELM